MTLSTPRRKSRHFVLRLLFAEVIYAALIIPTIAHSDETETTFRQTMGIERTNELSYQDDVLQAGLEMTAFSNSEVLIQSQLDSGLKLRFAADLLITGYPETDGDIDYQTGISAEALRNFGQGNVWQGRLKFEVDRQVSDGDWTFQRARVGARLRYQPDRHHSTTAHIRLGFRDQNEATFSGYDQAEYLAEVSHAWRPWSDRRMLSGTLYVEARRAEEEKYSYDEVGLRLAAGYPISESTELMGRFTAFDRSFGFDEASGQRQDTRFLGTLAINYEISDGFEIEAFAGWDRNTSTFADRAFEGAVAGINLVVTFD